MLGEKLKNSDNRGDMPLVFSLKINLFVKLCHYGYNISKYTWGGRDMFKKHRQLIIGFLLGALVFSIIPVGATVQDYILKKSSAKLMVDEKEFSNKELPVLLYKGYNYIPAATFRDICDKLGVGFEYVGEKNKIQINTKKIEVAQERKDDKVNFTTPKIGEEERGNFVETEIITDEGLKVHTFNGEEYVALYDINEKYKKDNSWIFSIRGLANPNNIKEILIERKDIPVIRDEKSELTYVTVKYFKEQMLPVLQDK